MTMCSNMGISVRCFSSCAQMSSPSGTNGMGVNGPIKFEKEGDRYHAVVDGTAHRVLGAYVVVVRVWVGHERRVGEVFDGVVIGGHVERFLPEPVVAATADVAPC